VDRQDLYFIYYLEENLREGRKCASKGVRRLINVVAFLSVMNLRSLLFKKAQARKEVAREVEVTRLRDVLDAIRETPEGLIRLDKALTSRDPDWSTRYGSLRGTYASLDGNGKAYDLFYDACLAAENLVIGTQWQVPGGLVTIPLVEQVDGALLWWFETHKYELEESDGLQERLGEEAKQIPLQRPGNVARNGATYDGKLSSRKKGKLMRELALHGIPVVAERAEETWKKIVWGKGKTQYANMLESGQPNDGLPQRFLTAEALAFLYKVTWLEEKAGNEIPQEYSVLLRPTRKMLALNAGMQRVLVNDRALHRYERSLLIGAALREQRKEPWALLHQSHKIEEISRKEMFKVYSSSGL